MLSNVQPWLWFLEREAVCSSDKFDNWKNKFEESNQLSENSHHFALSSMQHFMKIF